MAARSWCSTERLVAPHLLVGLEELLAPPIHNLAGAMRKAFPSVTALALQTAVTRCPGGSALVTVGFSYTGAQLPVVAGDVERLIAALQTPTVVHACPPVGTGALDWVRCGNDGCSNGCAAPEGVPGWFLVGCCGLAHLPPAVVEHLDWRCGGCGRGA